MKKFVKILVFLLIIFFAIGIIILGYFTIQGYNMYKSALAQSSIEERIEEIRSQERLPYYR